jgi:hypothetical protein
MKIGSDNPCQDEEKRLRQAAGGIRFEAAV